MNRLDGKVALVTGAARGLGQSIARAFIGAGAQVVLADVMEAPGEAAATALGSAARFQRLDVRHALDWEVAVAATEVSFGPISILVNNAVRMDMLPFGELTEAEFRAVFEVNELGCFLGMRAVLGSMRRTAKGSIINISSIAGMHPSGGIAYSSSKWAIRGMSKSVARELAPEGIRVNSVHPGWMRTPSTEGAPLEEVAKRLPLRSIGEPGDVARLIVFLASDDAGYITGSEYLIDGGALLMGTFELIDLVSQPR
jgi:3alpha(or 20beta)-hydroxysteroid dehydrogenase